MGDMADWQIQQAMDCIDDDGPWEGMEQGDAIYPYRFKTCRYCGKDMLIWGIDSAEGEKPVRYRLVDFHTGKWHECKEYYESR